jgi:hypothetical protein
MEAAISGMGIGVITSTTTGTLNYFLKKHPNATNEDIKETHQPVQDLTESTTKQQKVLPEPNTTLEENFKKTNNARTENGLGDPMQGRQYRQVRPEYTGAKGVTAKTTETVSKSTAATLAVTPATKEEKHIAERSSWRGLYRNKQLYFHPCEDRCH